MCAQHGLCGFHYIHSTSQQLGPRGLSIEIHLETWWGTWNRVRAQNTPARWTKQLPRCFSLNEKAKVEKLHAKRKPGWGYMKLVSCRGSVVFTWTIWTLCLSLPLAGDCSSLLPDTAGLSIFRPTTSLGTLTLGSKWVCACGDLWECPLGVPLRKQKQLSEAETPLWASSGLTHLPVWSVTWPYSQSADSTPTSVTNNEVRGVCGLWCQDCQRSL